MKRRNITMAMASVAVVAGGCTGSLFGDDSIRASGEIVEDARDLNEFTSLSVEGPVEVTVVTDGTHRVEMRMDRELERRAMFDTSDGRFSLDFPDDMSVEGPIVAELTIHVARLDDLDVESTASVSFDELAGDLVVVDVSGASRVVGDGVVAGRLELDVSGASTAEFGLAVGGVTTVDLSGASDVTLTGRSVELVLDASGSSDVEALALDAGAVRLDLSGASSARVTSSDEVDGELSGASDLHVRGDASVDVDTSGASTVVRS